MKDNDRVSIFNYLKSFISFRFFNQNKLYCLLVCSSAPLLVGSPSVASVTVTQQIAQASPTASFSRPSLKAGSQGEAVTELQAALKLLGFYSGAVDGKYGETTVAAVSNFKESAGLAPDGVVDTVTWQKLFPGQGNISTTTASSLPAPTTNTTNTATTTTTTSITSNRFPIPSQNTQNSTNLPRPVVVSNSDTKNSLPRPNNPTNTGNAQQIETVRASSITRTSTTKKPQQPKVQSRSTSAQNRSSTSTNTRTTTTSRSGRNNSSTSTSNRTATTSNRSGRSTASTSTTTRSPRVSQNQQKPGIQYTAVGFPILRLGMRGDEVYELQRRLQRFGYLKNDPDGDFGAATETAVKALQQRFGLEADGVAGGETWEILTRRRSNKS
ncbi:MAG: hypothetical protein HC903_31950 [Methylacidiphilales bacterium]|nr:hypothetical protein [Candidatus Methylacidiphilales bacterium]NJR17001.1 hypothetical protein [Calothrix sp. CSU_2_0]